LAIGRQAAATATEIPHSKFSRSISSDNAPTGTDPSSSWICRKPTRAPATVAECISTAIDTRDGRNRTFQTGRVAKVNLLFPSHATHPARLLCWAPALDLPQQTPRPPFPGADQWSAHRSEDVNMTCIIVDATDDAPDVRRQLRRNMALTCRLLLIARHAPRLFAPSNCINVRWSRSIQPCGIRIRLDQPDDGDTKQDAEYDKRGKCVIHHDVSFAEADVIRSQPFVSRVSGCGPL
jgi:hypothetical protein